VLDWLDRGLRRGEARLAAEYPQVFGPDAQPVQRVVFEGAAPAAHALLHPVEVVARGRVLRVGLLGSVYSDPAFRGRGFALACVSACLDAARAARLPLVLLWSDLADFYARLGFLPAGRDTLLALDTGLLARLAPAGFDVGPPEAREFAALGALYRAKPVHVHRAPDALARHAAAPETRLVVARRAGVPVAYAALGRGDDFHGVVHEWAGDGDAVLACLGALVRAHGPLHLLAGPEPETPLPALRAARAAVERRPLGLVRLLDAGELWRAVAPRPLGLRFVQRGERVELSAGARSTLLSAAEALELFFGAGPALLGDALDPLLACALEGALPWPLYVWGFDSV
jgi:GNAT superfamily N-acetyltransferase